MSGYCEKKPTCIQSSKTPSIIEDTNEVKGMTKGLASLGLTDLSSNLFDLGQELYQTCMKWKLPNFTNMKMKKTFRRKSSEVSTLFFWKERDEQCGIHGATTYDCRGRGLHNPGGCEMCSGTAVQGQTNPSPGGSEKHGRLIASLKVGSKGQLGFTEANWSNFIRIVNHIMNVSLANEIELHEGRHFFLFHDYIPRV